MPAKVFLHVSKAYMTVYIITKFRGSSFSHSEFKVGGAVLKVKVFRCESNKNTEIIDIIDIYYIYQYSKSFLATNCKRAT